MMPSRKATSPALPYPPAVFSDPAVWSCWWAFCLETYGIWHLPTFRDEAERGLAGDLACRRDLLDCMDDYFSDPPRRLQNVYFRLALNVNAEARTGCLNGLRAVLESEAAS